MICLARSSGSHGSPSELSALASYRDNSLRITTNRVARDEIYTKVRGQEFLTNS